MPKLMEHAVAGETYEVHCIPSGIQRIHRNYGLWIISCSSNTTRIDSYYNCRRRYFEFYSLSHMYAGEGCLWLQNNGEMPVKAGQCVIICPGTVNRYGGFRSRAYMEDAIGFSGPVADMMRRSGIIKDGIFEFGEARSLLPLMKLASDPAEDAQINANIMLQKLLIDIYNENRHRNNARSELAIDKLLNTLKEQTGRWWTVQEMADFCNLSDDQLRHIFKKRTGMLPKIYIDRLKARKAVELLLSGDSTVAEIAGRLGYVDQYHFSRRFKKLTGLSPFRYRQTFRN
ncbi:MAG: AraC family transcriptional regulator [Victivallales bacterium]|nr:AraC family transcriptional regulator [Victivallales bacterium]